MCLLATATWCGTAKKFCDALHNPAVASWVNCLNIYLVFWIICSSLHGAPSTLFQYLRQLALALLKLLPLTMQSQRPVTWTGYLWSQITVMHWKMPALWCLSANHPVQLSFCEVWEHVLSIGLIWKPAHYTEICTVTMQFLQILPLCHPLQYSFKSTSQSNGCKHCAGNSLCKLKC